MASPSSSPSFLQPTRKQGSASTQIPTLAPVHENSSRMDNGVRQWSFGYETPAASGAPVSLWGGYYKKNKDNTPMTPALIPVGTPSFEFSAFFQECAAGYYVVRWRITLEEGFSIPNGLHFRIGVNYSAEEDTTGSFDVIMSHEKLKELGTSGTFDLELEELVVIQPYQLSDEEWSMVVISMSNCGGIDDKITYSGLQVEHVELRPMGSDVDNAAKAKAKAGTQGDDITKRTVERAATPAFTMESSVAGSLPITRIAWSKDNTFLAALALSDDIAHITVWNMKDLHPSEPRKDLLQERTATTPKYSKGNLQELSIGLAISPDGDQVAVYQEPKIGQWADGSNLNEGDFQFLLLFPQPSQPSQLSQFSQPSQPSRPSQPSQPSQLSQPSQPGQPLLLETSQPIQEVTKKTDSNTTDPSSTGGNVIDHHSTTVDIPGTAGYHCLPHDKLKHFIGYGAFFPEARKNNLGMASSTTCLVSPSAGNNEGEQNPKNTGDATDSNTVFVACNGIYIDVFVFTDISGPRWRNTHSISLIDLIPTISRRVTCKMMIDAMSRNKFMWFEVGGTCCSIWDFQNGSNVSYISNPHNAKLGSLIVRGNKTMSLSPDESMAVVAAVDGSLTTFYVNTGVAISNRKFPDHQIEYVAFNGQNSQLFVMTRNNVTLQLQSLILDPLQLYSEIQANQVPVPIIGRTIHASFEGFENTKFVFEADRSKINCYVAHKPVGKIAITDSTQVKPPGENYSPTEDVYEKERKEDREEELQGKAKNKEEPKKVIKKDKLYEVRTAAGMKLSRDDDDSMYWILRVEVVEKDRNDINDKDRNEKVIFSFVPEPWMRISAADVRRPEDHQKVYFLPERSRFVVVGMQTLQIWSLPTKENRDLSLLFIWSRPKVNDDLPRLKENPIDHTRNGGNLANQDHTGDNLTETSDNTASSQEPASNSKKPGRRTIETEPVGEFYHYIRDAEVFFDCETGEVEARVTLEGGFGVDTVRIPGERSSNNRSVFLNCAQSIHLLAASYAYSAQEDKLPKIQGKSSFTFKEHSEAIARFTRSHINRLLHSKYFKPLPLSEPVVYVPRQPVQEQTTSPRGKPGTSNQESDASYQLLFLLRSEASAEKPRSSQNTPSSVELLKNMVYDFVQTNVARLWNRNDEDAGRDETFTVLTLLLGEESLKEANRLFIEGLFKDGHEWVPHPSLAVNPIERVIDMEDERLLTIMIDYCIKNAHDHHPGYLTPVTQCLIKLREVDAELVRDVFKRASHIPVRNPQYVTSHAIITNLRFLDLFSFLDQYASSRKFFEFSKSSKIEKYKAPVLGLRSKLPFHNHTGVVGSISDHIRRRRKTQFPPEKVADQTGENRRKIYVSPFQFKPFKGQSRSFLGEFAGENFFDSPVMEANLWYKWNKSGIYFWLLRFIVVLIYFILVLTITGQQIRVSTPSIEHKPTQEELEDRYLPGWHPAFYMTITIGCLLLIYEFLQMKFSTWKYFRSPFNYIELVAYISPVAGCFIFMQERLLEYFRDKITEGGPSQIIILAFAIIAIYVNMVSELRIIRPLGIAVNIIINITKKIGWFLFIFALFLISFTHALLYVLHTRRYRECEVKDEDGSCKDSDYPSNYPTNFFEALGTTYFFMSGRYDPVDTSFDKGTVGFRLMMMVFFFFTVIVLLNVLIALMNDAFNKSEREGEIAYWRLLSEVIAELEMVSWYYQGKSIDDDDNYSEYIYYVKSDEEVKQFQARCATSDVSTLAQSVKDEHKETRRTIVDDNKGELLAVKQELEDLKDLIRLLVQQQSPQPQGGTASQNNTQSPDNTQSQVDTLSQRNTSSQGNTQS